MWLLVPSAITVPNVEAHGLPLPLRPLDAKSWSLRCFVSYRRRERLTPLSANRSWSFAPLRRASGSRQALRLGLSLKFPKPLPVFPELARRTSLAWIQSAYVSLRSCVHSRVCAGCPSLHPNRVGLGRPARLRDLARRRSARSSCSYSSPRARRWSSSDVPS